MRQRAGSGGLLNQRLLGAPVMLSGGPFSSVFNRPTWAPPDHWRVRGSGVWGFPERSKRVQAVLQACRDLGIPVLSRGFFSPANADAYCVKARFLDGGIDGQTGTYLSGPRGVWVHGRKAVQLLAFTIGLKPHPAWLSKGTPATACLNGLLRELELENLEMPSDAFVNLPRRPLVAIATEDDEWTG